MFVFNALSQAQNTTGINYLASPVITAVLLHCEGRLFSLSSAYESANIFSWTTCWGVVDKLETKKTAVHL